MENNEPMNATSNKGSGITAILIILIIVVLVILALTKKPKDVNSIPEEGVTAEELESIEQTNDQAAMSDGDDLDSIESDLEATNFSELEADSESF